MLYMISLHQQYRVSHTMYLQYAVSHRMYLQYGVSPRIYRAYNIDSISAPTISTQDQVTLHQQYSVSPRMHSHYRVSLTTLHQQSPRTYTIESLCTPTISSQSLPLQYRGKIQSLCTTNIESLLELYLQYNMYMISLHQQYRVSPRTYL